MQSGEWDARPDLLHFGTSTKFRIAIATATPSSGLSLASAQEPRRRPKPEPRRDVPPAPAKLCDAKLWYISDYATIRRNHKVIRNRVLGVLLWYIKL